MKLNKSKKEFYNQPPEFVVTNVKRGSLVRK